MKKYTNVCSLCKGNRIINLKLESIETSKISGDSFGDSESKYKKSQKQKILIKVLILKGSGKWESIGNGEEVQKKYVRLTWQTRF